MSDELDDEEQAILAFVRRYLEEKNMLQALAVADEGRIQDLRTLIEGYRDLYNREGRH